MSIDGGGIRGVYPATILAMMQEELGTCFYKDFDLIIGTSTGAIIAAGLAINIPAQTIVEMYINQGAFIFEKSFLGGVMTPKYDTGNLKQVLDGVLGDKTFKNVKTRLMVTATNISDGMPWVFKSFYHDRLTRDRNMKLVDAVMASCAAPLYFNPYLYHDYLLADGGLWASNPALAALVEAIGHNIEIKKYKVRLLSIGTGINIKHYPLERANKQWGAMRWGIGLIDLIFNMQSLSVEKYLSTLMDPKHYLRINFKLDENIKMDDYKAIDGLIYRGVRDFDKYKIEIQDLIAQ